jgi:hypothetical protein
MKHKLAHLEAEIPEEQYYKPGTHYTAFAGTELAAF